MFYSKHVLIYNIKKNFFCLETYKKSFYLSTLIYNINAIIYGNSKIYIKYPEKVVRVSPLCIYMNIPLLFLKTNYVKFH